MYILVLFALFANIAKIKYPPNISALQFSVSKFASIIAVPVAYSAWFWNAIAFSVF